MTVTPAGRARASRRPRSNKTARATTTVLDLVDEASDVEGDQVIDLSPATQASSKKTAPATPAVAPPAPAADPRFLALGLPVELAPTTAATADLRTELRELLSHLPPAPSIPRTRGVVIAIVGIDRAPIGLARSLAHELDVAAEHVLLSTPETMSDLSRAEGAEAFRRSCRRRAEPTIVACSIGSGRAQLGWAYRMLERLDPTITWAVVDASVKVDDIAHRIELLGSVDVIALTGVADTVSPAAVLGLGIPVGRIGSNRATPDVWADLLLERLER